MPPASFLSPSSPEFPAGLLKAWREDSIVFFCGAGVSKPSGLPLFDELAKAVVMDVHSFDLDAWPTTTPLMHSLKCAYDAKKYDQLFGMLETLDDYGKHLDDQQRKDRLYASLKIHLHKEDMRHSGVHELVVHAARTPNGGRRIVTTNFDCLFEKAMEGLNSKDIFCAPNLPVVRPKRWRNGLVKLHGCIKGELDDLVLTTQSYGLAYFQDGWASSFLRELFQHYTVVFVGYSLADTVVEYLLHGYGALKNEIALKDAYIFLEAPGERTRIYQNARIVMMGIEPIFYENPDGTHQELCTSLERLVSYCTRNTESVKPELINIANQNPKDPTAIKSLETWVGHDPLAIKYFLEAADAAWLPVITENHIFKKYIRRLVDNQPIPWKSFGEDTQEQKVSWWLMEWFIRHHTHHHVVAYLLKAGGFVHPQLLHNLSLKKELQETKKNIPHIYAIWEILLQAEDMLYAEHILGKTHSLTGKLKQLGDADLPLLLQHRILQVLTPKLRITGRDHLSLEPECSLYKVFEVTLSERAAYGVNELANLIIEHPQWLSQLAPHILSLMQRIEAFVTIIGNDMRHLSNELDPLHHIATACIGASATGETASCLADELRCLTERRRPLDIHVEQYVPKPKVIITEEEFEKAWNNQDIPQIHAWLEVLNPHSIDPTNNVEDHISRTLQNEMDKAYEITEQFIEQGLQNEHWWQMLLRKVLYDSQITSDWERLTCLACQIPQNIAQDYSILVDLCRALEKSAQGSASSPALPDRLFWNWWHWLLPLAQAEQASNKNHNLSNHALNHPLGIIALSLIARLWHDTEGKRERIIVSAWTEKLEMMLTPAAGSRAAWVILAGDVRLLLHLLPDWAKEHLIPYFDWNRTDPNIPILPIQAWNCFLHCPQLSETLVEMLLPAFVTGIELRKINEWKKGVTRTLLDNYIECLGNMWVDGLLNSQQQAILLGALLDDQDYAAALLSHWQRGFGTRDNKGWDKDYLQKTLDLLAKHSGIIHGIAIENALYLILNLTEQELSQYGSTLIAAVAKPRRDRDQGDKLYCHALLQLLDHKDDTQNKALAIWNFPDLLLDLLAKLLLQEAYEFYSIHHLSKILTFAAAIAETKGIVLNQTYLTALRRKAEGE